MVNSGWTMIHLYKHVRDMSASTANPSFREKTVHRLKPARSSSHILPSIAPHDEPLLSPAEPHDHPRRCERRDTDAHPTGNSSPPPIPTASRTRRR